VGTYLNFVDTRSFYQYLGGFDPEFGHLGLGKLAIVQGIRSSIELGRRHYDFMLGDEQHKYFFGAEDRMVESFVFASDRPASRLAAGLLTGRARLKTRLQATA
jgi:CelD/BcsL family acetyltransferase involved in cellulose biosynthesis